MVPAAHSLALLLLQLLTGQHVLAARVGVELELQHKSQGIRDDLSFVGVGIVHQFLITRLNSILKVSRGEVTGVPDDEKIFVAPSNAETGWSSPTIASVMGWVINSCARDMDFGGLGTKAASESSRSGAVFLFCKPPSADKESHTNYKQVLLKGGIRNGKSSPEWKAFKKMAPSLWPRFEDPNNITLLNRVYFGFDFLEHHWLGLESMSAQDLVPRLKACPGITFDETELSFKKFDLKPYPSRAPELPEALMHLQGVPMLGVFYGWHRLREALYRDLIYLDAFKAVDQSLYLQVAGPIKVKVVGDVHPQDLLELIDGKNPKCAIRLEGEGEERFLSVVCISIFDYFLTWNFFKSIQNFAQDDRWTHYSWKMVTLFECLGHLRKIETFKDNCWQYFEMQQKLWRHRIKMMYQKDVELQKAAQERKKTSRCCCRLWDGNISEADVYQHTECEWQKYGEEASKFWGCSIGFDRIKVKHGGCLKEVGDHLELIDP